MSARSNVSSLMVVGGQWGDEGKGKVVDLLSDRFDVVARFQGGPNAGHTVVVASNDVEFAAEFADRVVVLADAFWRTRFAADPDIVGSSITLDGAPFTVVGVVEARFHGPDPGRPA